MGARAQGATVAQRIPVPTGHGRNGGSGSAGWGAKWPGWWAYLAKQPGWWHHPCCGLQKEVAQLYSSFQATYTVGYGLSLGALLLALAVLLGCR